MHCRDVPEKAGPPRVPPSAGAAFVGLDALVCHHVFVQKALLGKRGLAQVARVSPLAGVTTQVVHEAVPPREFLAALGTLVPLFSGVRQPVVAQRGLLAESGRALVAGVGPLSRVRAHVADVGRLAREVAAALVAGERPAAPVGRDVDVERALPGERGRAQLAGVGLLARVRAAVNDEIPFGGELAAAHAALVRLLARVRPQVSDEVSLFGEFSAAQRAGVRLLARMHHHVLADGVVRAERLLAVVALVSSVARAAAIRF